MSKAPLSRLTLVKSLEKEFVKNANAMNAAKLVREYYTPNAILIPADEPKNRKGTKAIVDFWKGLFECLPKSVTIKTESVQASGDLAYEIGRFGFTPTKGEDLTRATGKFVVIYRKQKDGSLKAEVDIFNNDKKA